MFWREGIGASPFPGYNALGRLRLAPVVDGATADRTRAARGRGPFFLRGRPRSLCTIWNTVWIVMLSPSGHLVMMTGAAWRARARRRIVSPRSSSFDRSCMAMIRLPTEFKEFLRLLNSAAVDYLVVGGYAVAFHGHPRATGDFDIWIATRPENVTRIRRVLAEFGFPKDLVASAPLDVAGKVIRMGNPPLRIELLTSVTGVDFGACHRRREMQVVDSTEVAFISLPDLLANKRATGRTKDIADIEELS